MLKKFWKKLIVSNSTGMLLMISEPANPLAASVVEVNESLHLHYTTATIKSYDGLKLLISQNITGSYYIDTMIAIHIVYHLFYCVLSKIHY